ncbi:MAG: hypothetical protein COB02_15385 [Candidatus Cloacimonadota bacterium]|nr:MAG: hypothetical protein COB02_15385 [Candidatus Cloacimonadota bacterium]
MKNKGMSVVEIMISITVLLAFSIPMIGLASLSKASSKRNTTKTQALLIAQSYIDDLRYSMNKFGRATTRKSILIPKKFKVKKVFSVYGTSPGIVNYSVTIKYKEFRNEKSITLNTLISQKGSVYEY